MRARRFAIALVVLVVLLVAADRIGLYIAERTAGDTIQSSQHLTSRPDVDIAGIPFLTQLATGHFGRVTVTATEVPVGRGAHVLDISRIRVVLHTVTTSRDFSSVHAKSATATAVVSYAELGKTLGLDVGYAGGGRITASKNVIVAGRTIRAGVTARPAVTRGALAFTDVSVEDAGRLGAAVAATLGHVFDLTVPLQGIPFNIRVTGLRTDEHGVTIELVGSDLSYTG